MNKTITEDCTIHSFNMRTYPLLKNLQSFTLKIGSELDFHEFIRYYKHLMNIKSLEIISTYIIENPSLFITLVSFISNFKLITLSLVQRGILEDEFT